MHILNGRCALIYALLIASSCPDATAADELPLSSDPKCYAVAGRIKTEIKIKHGGLVDKIEYFDPSTRGMTLGVKSPVAERQQKIVFRLASTFTRSTKASPSNISRNQAIIASPKLLSDYIQPLILDCHSIGSVAFSYHDLEIGWSIVQADGKGLYLKSDECISPYDGRETPLKWGEKLCP